MKFDFPMLMMQDLAYHEFQWTGNFKFCIFCIKIAIMAGKVGHVFMFLRFYFSISEEDESLT